MVSGDTLTIIGMDVNDRGYYYCTAVGADATTRVTSDRPALVDFKGESLYFISLYLHHHFIV